MSPRPLVVSYSGVRGVVGESLTVAVAEKFGDAFGQMIRVWHTSRSAQWADHTVAQVQALLTT